MAKIFYSPQYCAASYSFDTTRKASWIAESLISNPIDGVVIEEPQPLSPETVRETHTADYVNAIETGEPWSVASSQGFRWCRSLYPSVLSSNGGLVAAVRAALEDGIAGTLSSGMHHARAGYGLGFCTFNGLAIAAKEAVRLGVGDVLILDLDAHGGGGTASLISGEVRIAQLDIAVERFDLSPDTIDMSGKGPIEYLTVLDALLKECRPGLCIYNAGMDVHEKDCGPRGFDANAIAAREVTVFEWASSRNVPIAYTLAGGYSSSQLPKASLIGLHRCTIRAAEHFSRKDSSCLAAAT